MGIPTWQNTKECPDNQAQDNCNWIGLYACELGTNRWAAQTPVARLYLQQSYRNHGRKSGNCRQNGVIYPNIWDTIDEVYTYKAHGRGTWRLLIRGSLEKVPSAGKVSPVLACPAEQVRVA